MPALEHYKNKPIGENMHHTSHHTPIEINLSAYESAPHRLARLAGVVTTLAEGEALSVVRGLHDHKGTLEVTATTSIKMGHRAVIRSAWEAQGEIGERVEFVVE
jgi:hypothetical protein